MSRLKSPPFRPSPVVTVVVAVLVALVGLIPQYLSRTIPDVAFPLWAAGRVLDGATLYVDILEINPPLFIWLDIPLVALARWTGLDPILVFRVAVTGLLVASVWFTQRVVADGRTDRRIHGWANLLRISAVTFALFVLPRLDWGEREHLALALMLPWLAVAVRRVEGREVSRRMALLTGVAAGVGIALKPHFVLVWVGRELAIRLGGSADRRLGHISGLTEARTDGQTDEYGWARADTWAPVVVCVAYLAAAVVLTPEYFPLVQELAGPYSRFIRATVVETMFGPAPAVALASLVIAVGLMRLRPAEPPNRRAAVLILWWTTAAWSVVAVLQLKGFRYHWYPAMALGFLLLWLLSRMARGGHFAPTFQLFRAVGTATLATTLAITTWNSLRQAANPIASEWDADGSMAHLIQALGGRIDPGDTLAVLSPHLGSGFPLTNYLGTVWPLRLNAIWPAVEEYRAQLEMGLDQRVYALSNASDLERRTVAMVAEDLERARPGWIIILRNISHPGAPYMARVRMRAFLERESRVSRLFTEYDSLGTIGLYTVWSRQDLHQAQFDAQYSGMLEKSPMSDNGAVRLAPGMRLGVLLFMAALVPDLLVVVMLARRR